jgi:predicted peroxiredoxin
MSWKSITHELKKIHGTAWVWALPLMAVFCLLMVISPLVEAGPQSGPVGAIVGGRPDKVAFFLTTGLEDIHALDTLLRYAVSAKESGQLSEVAVLADSRGVEILCTDAKARPAQTAALAKQAKAAGVRFLVTAPGLEQANLAVADLDPRPDEIVPDGGIRLSGLISQNYRIIHF